MLIYSSTLYVHTAMHFFYTCFFTEFILILTANLRSPAWIGLNDRRVNNQFEWVDNTVVSYTHWGPGQPSENTQDRRPDARVGNVRLS